MANTVRSVMPRQVDTRLKQKCGLGILAYGFPVSTFQATVSRFPFPVSRFPFPVSRWHEAEQRTANETVM